MQLDSVPLSSHGGPIKNNEIANEKFSSGRSMSRCDRCRTRGIDVEGINCNSI